MAGREIELINDRDLARKRLPIFAGQTIPSTVVRKEIIDNTIDVVGERGQRADECVIRVSPNRLWVMDNGSGISTSKKEGMDVTHLWLACAKMFSSSNYGGVSDSVGANGVGLTIANYTSKLFRITLFNRKNVEYYQFMDGFLTGTQECLDNVNQHPELFDDTDKAMALEEGDCVSNPISVEEGTKLFHPMYEIGFMVDVTWFPNEKRRELFPDEADLRWLEDYTAKRVGELASGKVTFERYSSDEMDEHSLLSRKVLGKNPDEIGVTYVPSWKELCEQSGAAMFKEGPWTIALSKNSLSHVNPVVQGAPVKHQETYGAYIEIQEYRVRVQVPVTFQYVSKDYPPYQDQTKTEVRFPSAEASRAFQRSGEIYQYFYREAEKAYMAKVIKDSGQDNSMFWPALGDPSEAELIIAEGYSAISGLKSQRNPKTQACIALRGKFLNTWNLDVQKAMRSEVVKQILDQIINVPYKAVIIACDEDSDGSHIRALLLALIARFTNLIQQGKVFFTHTPHYIFKKRGQDIRWSDDARDCPAGWHTTTLKGLGGLEASEVEKFIMNHETRELVNVQWDDKAWKSLDDAFTYGCEGWIVGA